MIDWSNKNTLRRRDNKDVRAVEVHVIPEWTSIVHNYCVLWSDGTAESYKKSGACYGEAQADCHDVIPAPRSGEGMVDPLTEPIARDGEPIYASIQRERSGVDSGIISPKVRIVVVEELCDGDQRDMVSASLMLVEMVLCNTKRRNHTCTHILHRVVKKFGDGVQE